MLSFWEQTALVPSDVIIIGGGITGLSAALSVKELSPNASVRVIDRGVFPFGASTRNAGFACFGSLSEIHADIQKEGLEHALKLVEMRVKGLEMLRNRVPDPAMNFNYSEGGELILHEQYLNPDLVSEINLHLKDIFKANVFEWSPEKVHQFGFSPLVKGFISNQHEAGIHSGKMIQHLQHLCRLADVEIISSVEVRGLEQGPNGWMVELHESPGLPKVVLTSPLVLLATNAFTSAFIPDMEITPGRGQIWVTNPIKSLQIKGIIHADSGYVYFRELEGRVLIGGGRNVDFEGEETIDFGRNKKVTKVLEYYLNDIVLPELDWEIEYEWSGIMAFGPEKWPVVKELETGLVVVARMSGMGIALASAAAAQGAAILLKKNM